MFQVVLQKYKMAISLLGNENVQFLHDARGRNLKVSSPTQSIDVKTPEHVTLALSVKPRHSLGTS